MEALYDRLLLITSHHRYKVKGVQMAKYAS
jgi:hypothetical protein